MEESNQSAEKSMKERCAEVTRLQMEVDQFTQCKETLMQGITEKISSLADAHDSIDNLRTELDSLGGVLQTSAADLVASKGLCSELQDENRTLGERLKDIGMHYAKMELDMAELETDKVNRDSKLQQEHRQVIEKLDNVELKLKQSVEWEKAARDELSQKLMEISEAAILQSHLENCNENLSAELSKSEAERFQAENDIAYFRSRLAEFEAKQEGDTAREDLAYSRGENQLLRDCLSALTVKADELRDELDHSATVRAAMEEELLEVNVQLETLNNMLENAVQDDAVSAGMDVEDEESETKGQSCRASE